MEQNGSWNVVMRKKQGGERMRENKDIK